MKDERFTVKLAAADAVPVIFFSVAVAALATVLQSAVFAVGALLCILAGAGKVIWKFLIALRGKDVPWLGAQLRFVMPAGFVLMVIGALMADRAVTRDLFAQAIQMPVVIFFVIAVCALIAMIVCAKRYDRRDPKGNRIEQGLNIVAQGCVMIGVLLLVYAEDYYHADAEALAMMKSDPAAGAVAVSETDYGWFFDGPSDENVLIFYPGGKVEEGAYAPMLHLLAGEGMDVCLVKMPLRLAVLAANRADDVLADLGAAAEAQDSGAADEAQDSDAADEAQDSDAADEEQDNGNAAAETKGAPKFARRIYIGGHSLGGAMAASYAAKHSDRIDGVILLAAYPTKELGEEVSVISIYGSNDKVVDMNKIQETRQHVKGSLYELVIDGGNHAQFGDYGEQKGDGKAGISQEEQWRETVDFIIANIGE